MKKIMTALSTLVFIALCVYIAVVFISLNQQTYGTDEPIMAAVDSRDDKTKDYNYYKDYEYLDAFTDERYLTGLELAKKAAGTTVEFDDGTIQIVEKTPLYQVLVKNAAMDFYSFADALSFLVQHKNAKLYSMSNETLIYETNSTIGSAMLDAPMIAQNPELPRGCEVTSLCMLINYLGVSVDKMTLAEEIKKDTTPYERKNGKVYYGNPNDGFIGDMYNMNNRGFGVYHGPVYELLANYFPGKSTADTNVLSSVSDKSAIDITGCTVDMLYYFLENDRPVWIIINSLFRKLTPEDYWGTWITPSGEFLVTYREHSVLITGYDDNYFYINDPLVGKRSMSKEPFIEAWIQMGRQAVSVMP